MTNEKEIIQIFTLIDEHFSKYLVMNENDYRNILHYVDSEEVNEDSEEVK